MPLTDDTYALISSPQTDFGGIIPDVTVEEVYRDGVIITDHPTERGAPVTDHAFRRPTTFEMRCGFSNSTGGSEGYIDAAYQAMLSLLDARQPFDVFTPRRMLQSMLVSDIQVTRDEKTNSVLACAVSLRQIIIADTSASTSAPQDAQADPASTASTVDAGSKQLQPATFGLNGPTVTGGQTGAVAFPPSFTPGQFG